jgi:hypothetical protein
VQQDGEVAEFLRDLVCCSGEPSHHSKPDLHQEHRADGETPEEVVQGVTDEHKVGQWLAALRPRAVAVMPVKKLFEREE